MWENEVTTAVQGLKERKNCKQKYITIYMYEGESNENRKYVNNCVLIFKFFI